MKMSKYASILKKGWKGVTYHHMSLAIFPDRKLVVCDLDGTLVDSVPDLAYAVDEMLTKIGMPPAGKAKVRQWVGNGVERLVRRALLGRMEGEPNVDLFDRAYPILWSFMPKTSASAAVFSPG